MTDRKDQKKRKAMAWFKNFCCLALDLLFLKFDSMSKILIAE